MRFHLNVLSFNLVMNYYDLNILEAIGLMSIGLFDVYILDINYHWLPI